LDIGCAKGLCLTNVKIIYKNLSKGYEVHKYPPSQNWNYDEYGAQASQNGKALVLAQTGS
jgi:hypothetical protein